MEKQTLTSNDLTRFLSLLSHFQIKKKAPATGEEKEQAEKLKLEGNDLMRAEDFPGAIDKYTKYVQF